MSAIVDLIEPRHHRDPHAAAASARAVWLKVARQKQLPPPGKWLVWLNRCGRGYGKTRLGGEWISWNAETQPDTRWFVIAPTYNDVRFTCFEGESGILAHLPPACIAKDGYNKSYLEIRLWNGSSIRGFSATEPKRLRGPQCHGAWFDEIAACDKETVEEAWYNLEFGCRLGEDSRIVVTTTPRPVPIMRKIRKAKGTIVTTGSTYENRDNLAPSFFDRVVQYEGTTIGRQEIHGEEIDPEESGIIKRSWIKMWKMKHGLPRFEYIVYSLDTAFTEKTYDQKKGEVDPTAASVFGIFQIQVGVKRTPGGTFEKPVYRNNVMLLDAWADFLGFPALVERVKKELKSTYGTVEVPLVRNALYGVVPSDISGKGKKIDVVLIEDKGSGISLRQELGKFKVPTHAYNPGKADKMTRLHVVSHIPNAGLLWIPESRSTIDYEDDDKKFCDWAYPWMEEVCTFPNSDGDNYVDTLSQALRLFSDKNILTALPPKLYDDRRDDEDRAAIVRPAARRKNPYAS